ncbi:MAG: hypothetical protein LBU24_04385 [Methanocalculaceae archaeon]|nr:hypothetical protein [Methanocalculaceae archaeon]
MRVRPGDKLQLPLSRATRHDPVIRHHMLSMTSPAMLLSIFYCSAALCLASSGVSVSLQGKGAAATKRDAR